MSIESVKLADICEINVGKTPARNNKVYWGEGYTWLSIADMKQGKFITKSKEQITQEGFDASRIKLVPENTLVLSFKLSLGKVAFTTFPIVTNEAIAALPIKDENRVFSGYLYHTLKNLKYELYVDKAVMGLTLNKKKLAILDIPLPPLEEQKRIAAILDKADEIRQKRREAIGQCDEFLKATFLDMFGDPVTNPKGWRVKKLGELVKFFSGGTPSKARADFWEGTFPWVSPKDMKVTYISTAIDKISDLVFQETSLKQIPVGSLLIVVRGMILVHTVPFAMTRELVAINQDIKAMVSKVEIDTMFLLHNLMAQHQNILNQVATAAHGTKRLEMSVVEALPIIQPPLDLQNKFAEITKKTEVMKVKMQQSLQELDDNFNALMQKAFKGEL
ncbi:MAG: restriction endonuclease subunit S [Lentisphaeraceae bacterium]|nr:restriction endonuclease subunit S [Lentisphaeraceae bacterium]